MKKLFAVLLIFVCVVAHAFDISKRYDKTKIDDVVIMIQVPVFKDGNKALRPNVPYELRELRKADSVIYNASTREGASRCIIIMIVPKEYEEEFLKRVEKYDDAEVKVIDASEVADLKSTYKRLDVVVDATVDTVVTALTPVTIPK